MLWLIPLFPIIAAGLLYPWWRTTASRPALAVSAAGVVAVTLALVVVAGTAGWTGSLVWSEQLRLAIGFTPMTYLAALVVPLVAAPIVFYAAAHESPHRLARLLALLVAFTGVMELIVLARDLLSLLMVWEIAGALSWALIGHEFKDRERGRHASQAFLTTRTGDLGLYLAAFIAFQHTGSLAYADLGQMDPLALGLFAAGVTLAALSKSAQLPFAPWLFAAMSGPAPVSALLHAATMVAAGVILLMQFQPILAGVDWFGPLLIAAGLTTALAGGLVATATPHAKRLLAGSTSAHYGLMFVAIGAGYPAVALLHFAMHALMKAPLFMAAGIAGHRAGSYELGQIARVRLPSGLRPAALIAALALAGLVPLGPAWSKEAVVTSAGLTAPWLALLVAVAGGLSALYAARFQGCLFPRSTALTGPESADGTHGGLQRAPVYFLVALVILSSMIWLPGVHRGLGQWLTTSFPSTKLWEFVVSLLLVLAGLFLGRRFAAREISGSAQSSTVRTFLSQWMRLPQAAHGLIVKPVDIVAVRLATLDDRAVDAGIRASTRFTLWLANLGSRTVEWLFDELPEGLAQLAGKAGENTRQLQSGMLHHYYSLMGIGVVAMVLTLILGMFTGGFS
ncbi:proton-conducting transporter transmembrane domain-containing protein [Marinobacter fonticola]|uniref:proton-conducting transporter transmembrane domain-containing protein n=1 Tax=Marinobacter fonticola TaxID=2603215 RepID=UPI0011E7112E|nr:proton-conducting transporter membrane subunit [Marinobacter fonticola]